LYDVKVVVKDLDGGRAVKIENREFEVVDDPFGNADPNVLWIRVRERPGSRLDPGGEVSLGSSVRIYTRISDTETNASSLWVRIKYRVEGGSWVTATPTYHVISDQWRFVWDISLDAELGLYDVKVVVKDLDGRKAVKIENREFEIV
jgi:hypothetical protein